MLNYVNLENKVNLTFQLNKIKEESIAKTQVLQILASNNCYAKSQHLLYFLLHVLTKEALAKLCKNYGFDNV